MRLNKIIVAIGYHHSTLTGMDYLYEEQTKPPSSETPHIRMGYGKVYNNNSILSKHKIMNHPDKSSGNSDDNNRPNNEKNKKKPEIIDLASSKETLLSYIQAKNKPLSNRISVPLRQGVIELVQIEDIIYVESSTQICYIYLRDDTKLTAFKGLSYFKGLLSEEENFFPISDKILLNLNYLQRYNHKELTVSLTNKKTLYASRRGGQRLRKLLQDKNLY